MKAGEILDWIWDDDWEKSLRDQLELNLKDKTYTVETYSDDVGGIILKASLCKDDYIDIIINLARDVRKKIREN
jgi:hypothetical protein